MGGPERRSRGPGRRGPRKRTPGADLYVRLPGIRVEGHWHGVDFLTESQASQLRSGGPGERDEVVIPMSDPSLKDKYWLCENWEVVSTAEVVRRFAAGRPVVGFTGPHDTESAASDCADAAWDAPGGD